MILFGLIIATLVILGLRNPEAGIFGKDNVTVLKPFLAIGIVLHHLHAESIYLHEFERWGPLIVGIFFFISGYGLNYSYNRRPDYMKDFFTKKIVFKLILPVLLAFSLNFLLNENINDYSILSHLKNPSGPFFFSNDWFMYVLIYLYIGFLLATKLKKRTYSLAILLVWTFVLVLFTALKGYARNWWATPFAFCTGTLYYHYESYIRKLVTGKKGLLVSTIVYLIAFGCLIAGSAFFKSKITTVLAYSLLPLLVVNCMIRLDVSDFANNRIILYLSGISFEIYLIHGIIIGFLRGRLGLSGGLLIFSTFAATLVGAVLFKEISTLCRKYIPAILPHKNNI